MYDSQEFTVSERKTEDDCPKSCLCTITGTMNVVLSPDRIRIDKDHPRQSQQSQQQYSDYASPTIDDFLNDQANAEMVAPRSLALPGSSYTYIDEDAGVPTPEYYRQILAERSSLDSPEPSSLDLNVCESRNDWADNSYSSLSDRMDDSFIASQTTTLHPRAESHNRDRHSPTRRRVHFERNTRW